MKNFFCDLTVNCQMGSVCLQFKDKDLENSYTLDSNKSSILTVRFGIILIFLLFTVYGLVDLYAFPSGYKELWLIRVFIDLFLLGMFVYSFNDSYIKNLQKINIVGMQVIGVGLVYLYSFKVETDLMYIFVASYTLFISGSFTVFGLKFFNALIGNILSFIYLSVVFYFQFDLMSNIFYGILFLSIICITLVGSYFAEVHKRKLFLKDRETESILSKLKESQKDLQKAADFDYLTGLYNRRYLSTVSQELIKVAKRKKTSISILHFDIDNFKRINDTYGHSIGDDALKFISSLFREHVRDSDIVARVGGEEFAILLADTDRDDAYILAEKLRVAIEESRFIVADSKTLDITVSGGVASIDINTDKDMQAGMSKADKLMYKAKNSGKNKIFTQ